MKKRPIQPSTDEGLIQPRIGKEGKYLSLFSKIKRSWSSSDPQTEKFVPEEAERNLRENFPGTGPTISEIIEHSENQAVAIIESAGYAVKKPYDFSDTYAVPNVKPARPDGWATLPGLVEKTIGGDEWDFTYEGRAAMILVFCQLLRSSMESGNVERAAYNAMLLQRESDHLEFMPVDLATREGERLNFGRRDGGQKTARNRQKDNEARNREIVELFKSGLTTSQIEKRKGLSMSQIQRIVKPYR